MNAGNVPYSELPWRLRCFPRHKDEVSAEGVASTMPGSKWLAWGGRAGGRTAAQLIKWGFLCPEKLKQHFHLVGGLVCVF